MQNNVETQLAAVQNRCLLILREIDQVCREHHIEYSLTAGSVIGYHLYGGFIPWDDDIDLMMTRDHYDRFLKVWESKPRQYQLHNFENKKNRHMLISKIVDENSTVVENCEGYAQIVGGVFVDIAVFDKFPREPKKRKKFEFLSWFVTQARERVIQWKWGGGFQGNVRMVARNLAFYILRFLATPIYQFSKRTFLGVKTRDYDYAELMFGFKIPFPTELFDNYTDALFGGVRCRMVRDYMDYLECRYGRREFYKEKRDGDIPHHYLYVNCDLPYKQYLKENLGK